MEVRFILNQKQVAVDAAPDAVLMNVLRDLGCKSVKCGCETTNCGLCTVWIDGKSRLSCSVLAAGVEGHEVTTLEGVEQEAEEFGRFLAKEGAEQKNPAEHRMLFRIQRKSKNIWQAICAAVPGTWDSFARYRIIWQRKK